MLDLPNPLPKLDTFDPEDRLFIHTKRPEWGVGLWVREERTRRRVRFEDGKMRAFKKGFYHFLDPVDPERSDLDDVFESLADDQDQAMAEKAAAEARKKKPPVMSFADQLRVFEATYDNAFAGDDYIDAARHRVGKGKPCKRHVDEEVELAKAAYAKDAMKAQIDAGEHDDLFAKSRKILKRTTLVGPTKGWKRIDTVDEADRPKFNEALYNLLHGEKRFRKRFKAWVGALTEVLGDEPTWALATVFLGLYDPESHVCIKRRVYAMQARELRPQVHITRKVRPRSYKRARRVARLARKELEAAGHSPRDMLDVRRFMWDSLRPKGQQLLEELDKARKAA